MGKRKAVDNGEGGSRLEASSRPLSGIIEAANALSSFEFMDKYWNWDADEDATLKGFNCTIFCEYVEKLPKEMIDSCFDLIEQTSRHDYEPSSFGWHPKRKMKEMKEKEMRYIILTDKHSTDVMGFASFMLTHDSTPAMPVLYVYEIHLDGSLRGSGIGKTLMTLVEDIANQVGVDKVMLTCFKSNRKARAFYEHLSYGVDICSPDDRTTRKKTIRTDYVIMSKNSEKPKATESLQKPTVSTVSKAHPPTLNPETNEYRALRQEMSDRMVHLLEDRSLMEWAEGTKISKPFDDILRNIEQSGYFGAGLELATVAFRKLEDSVGTHVGPQDAIRPQHTGQAQAFLLMDVVRGFEQRFDAASTLQYQTWNMLYALREEMRALHNAAGARSLQGPGQFTVLGEQLRVLNANTLFRAMPKSMGRELGTTLYDTSSFLDNQEERIRQDLRAMNERERDLDQREQQLDQKEDDLFLRETALQEANARQDRARQNIRARARALQQREARFAKREQRDRERATHRPEPDALGVSAQECEEWRRAFGSARDFSAAAPGIETQVDWINDGASESVGDAYDDDQDDDLEGSDEIDDSQGSEAEEEHSTEDSDEEEAESEHSGEPDDEHWKPDSYRHDERVQTEGAPRMQGKHVFELHKPEAMRGRKVFKDKPETWLRRSGSTLDSFTKRH